MDDLHLREFGVMVQGARACTSADVCGIASEAAWDFFENLAFSNDKQDRFIETARFEGKKALRVKNFVGVITAPDGTQVEILPKTSEGAQDVDATRTLLWKMLGAVEDLRFLETTDTRLMSRAGPLTEALISRFVAQVAAVVRRGVRRDYERVEAEERFLRGRLRAVQQMQLPPGRRHLFRIEYDLFSEDRAENRLIHAALAKVCRTSRTPDNQRLARELLHGFHGVPLSTNHRADFGKWRRGRDLAHYQPLLPWLKLILDQQCPFSLKGEHGGISFLFPMEKLFEKYVAQVLKRRLAPENIAVHTQSRSESLSESPRAFQLKPDLVLARDGVRLCVMDTKWKLIDQHAVYDNGNDDPKAGVAQSDMYQLFAYGHKYLGGRGRLVLIYPKWSGFDRVLPPFRLNDGLILDVVPFDLATDACTLIDEMRQPATRTAGR